MSEETLSLSDFATQLSQSAEPVEQPQEGSTPEAEQVEQVEEATNPAEEVPEEGAEPSEEPSEEGGQAPEAPTDDLVIKWTTSSGESFETPIKELKDGYMRQSDYTQKTQAFAQEKEKVQAKVFEQYQLAQSLGKELGARENLQNQIQQYQQIPWQQLRTANPEQYNALATEFLVIREQAKELDQVIQLKTGQFENLQRQSGVEAANAATEHLRKVIPGFGEKHLSAMNDYMADRGVSVQKQAEIVQKLGKDLAPQVLEAIHDAAQWRALQAKKPELENKVKQIPPKPVAKASTAAKPTSRQEQVAKFAQSSGPMDLKSFSAALAQTRKQ